MANEFMTEHTVVTNTITPVQNTTVTTTTYIPKGSIITRCIWQNVAATTVTATLKLQVDTVDFNTAIAIASTTAGTITPTVVLTNVAPTLEATNGGLVGIVVSNAATAGTMRAIITYLTL